MSPYVLLETTQLVVQPGTETRLPIRIRNSGTIVESYRVDVVGHAASWSRVEPPLVSVYPGQEVEAEVVFWPVRSAHTPLGIVPFGVRAVSDVDATSSMVAEGAIDVAGIVDIASTILPRNSKGRWSGKHRVEIENRGNTPVSLRLRGHDSDELLDFRFKQNEVEIPVDGFVVTKVKAKIRSPYLRGPAAARPFKIAIEERASDDVSQRRIDRHEGHFEELDGTVAQRQIIGGSFAALTALIALLVGGYFAFTTLRPAEVTDEQDNAQAVPKPPEGLAGSPTGPDRIRLTWAAPTGDEQGFDVLEVVDGANRTLASDLPRGDSTYEVADLQANTEYCFVLLAFNSVGRSDPSTPVCLNTSELAAPPDPSGVTADISDDGTGQRILLGWTDQSGGQAQTHVAENDTVIAIVPAGRSSIELGRAPGTYCYEVRSELNGVLSNPAVDGSGVSRQCVEIAEPPEAVASGTLGKVVQLGNTTPIPEAAEAGLPGLDVFRLVYDQAQASRTSFQQQGHPTAILVESQSVGIPGDAGWAVIVPGFASDEEATEYCQSKGVGRCLIW